MKLIKADPERRIEIAGVQEPVRCPVDIDRSKTGFANLRSLRVYQFDAGTAINGDAEEDEVFVVVMAGSIEFSVSGAGSQAEPRTFHLSEFGVAYLPPQAGYHLVPKTEATVAYARATPTSGNPAATFAPAPREIASGVTMLIEEQTYARRLRLRLLKIEAKRSNAEFSPIDEPAAGYEALLHVRTVPPQGAITLSTGVELDSWDTAALAPGERPTLNFAARTSGLVLAVMAR